MITGYFGTLAWEGFCLMAERAQAPAIAMVFAMHYLPICS